MMKKFSLLKNPGNWRRIAVASWNAPNDPSVYGLLEFDFSRAQEFLGTINAGGGAKVTPTHLVAKAAALTLRDCPEANAVIRRGRIHLRSNVDLFIQVAIQEGDKADLSGAKIQSCDTKGLKEIAGELLETSGKIRRREDPQFRSTHRLLTVVPVWLLKWVIRFMTFLVHDLGIHSKKLGLPEDPFGSAMVTNIGSLGSVAGFAPINPMSRIPLLLCIGQITERPWVVDHQVVPRPVLQIGVTFDHRYLDGATAARMLKSLRELIEEPERLLSDTPPPIPDNARRPA